jgi:hypothetical protein
MQYTTSHILAVIATIKLQSDRLTSGSPEFLLLELFAKACTNSEEEDDLATPRLYISAANELIQWERNTIWGCTVYEYADGTYLIEWGEGDDYTWCGIQELLSAIYNGNPYPSWYEPDWNMVRTLNGELLSRAAVERLAETEAAFSRVDE